MSIREVDLSGVEEALEDGYKLTTARNNPPGIGVALYEGTEEDTEIIARGSSQAETGMVKEISDNEVRGPMSLPIALARAGADYQDEEKPEDKVDGRDAITELTWEHNAYIEGEYDEGDFVLLEGGAEDVEGRGESLQEAYEDFQLNLERKIN
jgi:hypothetical protein